MDGGEVGTGRVVPFLSLSRLLFALPYGRCSLVFNSQWSSGVVVGVNSAVYGQFPTVRYWMINFSSKQLLLVIQMVPKRHLIALTGGDGG